MLGPLLGAAPEYIEIANRDAARAHALAQEFSTLGEVRGCGFEAIDSDQFEAAAALAAVVRTAASRATSADVKAEAKEFTDELAQKHKRWDVVRKAENVLAASPDDKAANQALGLYYLFDRDEQAKGLAMLVKGSDAKLAAAAAARQKTVMSGVAGSVEEADAWFACVSTAPADYKGAIQKRAPSRQLDFGSPRRRRP